MSVPSVKNRSAWTKGQLSSVTYAYGAVHPIPNILIERNIALKRNIQTVFAGAFSRVLLQFRWAGSSVGIATGYGLDGPGIQSR